jgi:hypothetical protein
MELSISCPLSQEEKCIREIRKTFLAAGIKCFVVSRTFPNAVEVGLRVEGKEGIYYGNQPIGASTSEALHIAEIKAMVLVADEYGIELSFAPPVTPKPSTKQLKEWSFNTVKDYKSIDMLLKDLENDGVDISPIIAYKKALVARKKILSTYKVASEFFRSTSKMKLIVPIVEEELKRRKEKNPDMSAVFNKLKRAGWDEDRFKKSQYTHLFSSLLDFCSFAPDNELEKCWSK